MRRIAAVFSSSKRDKSDSTQSSGQNPARRSYTNLSLSKKKNIRATVNTANLPTVYDSFPPTPQLSAGQSSASSTGSASLQTHDDVPLTNQRRAKGKSWMSWLGNRSGSIKRVDHSPIQDPSWTLPPASVQPPVASKVPFGGIEMASETSESEEEEEDDEEDEHSPRSAREVLQAIVQNGLQRQPYSSPFVQQRGVPLFPRSCSHPRSRPRPDTIAVVMHKRKLLERLREQKTLTQWEEDSIRPFRSKKVSPALVSVKEPPVDEVAPSKTDIVSGFSLGLRQWVNRPPFEERLSIWLPIDETFTCQRVTSSFAVAALEFSLAIEAMADLPMSPISATFPTSPLLAPSSGPFLSASELLHPIDSPSPPSSVSSSVSASHSKPSPQMMISSPLRTHTDSSSSALSLSDGTEVTVASPTSPTAKRGVRFAEDDKEDTIPIGYVLRIKKQKEEKARFLREQRERRQFEEERRRHEEERQQRERERADWERERKAWEREKKAAEEERNKRRYAEEYAASRQRAENSRQGMRVSSSSSSLQDRPERPSMNSKRYSRLPYDNAPQPPRASGYDTASSSPHTSSPSSSRPPSIAGPSSSTTHQSGGHSRPSSFHSTHGNSSEDVRAGARPSRDRSHTTPGKTGSHTSLLLPPVPPMPPLPVMYPTDMPLLPPTAPFMMNAYSGRPSQSRSSSSSSRRSIPRNGSAESVNAPSHPRSGSSSPRVSHSQAPSSSSSTRPPAHHRRTSDESVPRHSSNSSRAPSYSQLSLPRGRSPYPAYNAPMIPNPWTAMPTQMGTIPTVMPYYSNHDPRMATTRRQTTFS
ncbi:hypothetical protein PM082_005549 [Marasmius tenuissimus]|nr:hypothetical protein PM082_005549 [Marasmius tenuissimus]